jgi:hypothetical protein
MAHLERDAQGLPILLTEPTRRELHEHHSEIVTPDSTSGPAEWGRYHDAVRECSRSFDNPEDGDIRQFLHARAREPEKVDVEAFHEAVKRQRMADLVDIVDHHMRRDGSLPRGSRHIRTQAPKGYLRRALRQTSPEDLAHLRHRLTSIGHDDEQVSDFLSSRVGDDNWDKASVYEINASEEEFQGLALMGTEDLDYDDLREIGVDDLFDLIAGIKPEIHIHIDKKELE